MMLGGVGFQVGLDEARQRQLEAQPRLSVAQQLTDYKALLDEGILTPEEFQMAKRKVLAG
jgi:hypothetical protein